jgi:hypothetical protein
MPVVRAASVSAICTAVRTARVSTLHTIVCAPRSVTHQVNPLALVMRSLMYVSVWRAHVVMPAVCLWLTAPTPRRGAAGRSVCVKCTTSVQLNIRNGTQWPASELRA